MAAACVLVAGGAAAQDKKMMKPSISVNGYYEGVVGGILDEDTDGDTTALDTRTDAEIHFNGRGSLDNGMKVHARVELEGQNNHSQAGDPIDEYFIKVSGSFGSITLGGTAGAPVKMLTGMSGSWATGVGENLSFDDGWVPSEGTKGGQFHRIAHSRLDTGDAEKVTYISPKFGGFQVGMTYSPNRQNDDDNSRNDTTAQPHDGLEGAVSYSGKFGDVGLAVGVGMTAYQGGTDGGTANQDWSDWLIAARFDFGGGFRVSAAHKRTTDDNEANQAMLTDIGVRFVSGANSFSLVGMHGELDVGEASHTKVMGSYARALGPGTTVHLNLLWNESQDTTGDMQNTGLAGIIGIKVGF